jgi:Uma2 family endonuclease
MNFELTKEGTIRMMTPTGNESSDAKAEITTQLRLWWKTHRRGRVFDSNTVFILPDGSKLGPDAAYITAERLATIAREALRGFAPVCPNFVIELLSRTDSLETAKEKMHDWIANGVELGWLINPYERWSYIYSASAEGFLLDVSEDCDLYGSGSVNGFVLDLNEVWRAYE